MCYFFFLQNDIEWTQFLKKKPSSRIHSLIYPKIILKIVLIVNSLPGVNSILHVTWLNIIICHICQKKEFSE